MKLFRCLPFLLLLAALPSVAEPLPVPADLGAFQQRAAEIIEANRVPGAGITLVRDGEVLWAGGVGYASREPEQHVISKTRFRIGSVTKMFTALAVLQLVEEGRLALDDRVLEIAPEVPIDNPWEATDPVLIAHLLEHTAGFDDMHFRNMNTDESLPESLRETVMRLEHELAVRWRPGVMHSYSNPGYAVAGYLVEKISGQPFHEYVNEHVLAPLDMQSAVWGVPADGYFAQGYTTSADGLRPVPPRAIQLYPAGELSASPADMARLLMLLLGRGEIDGRRLLDSELIERMETPHTTRAARYGLETGYGLGNYVAFRNGFRLHGHNGGLDGFVAEVAYSAEHDFGYAVLINRADPGTLKVLGELATAFLARNISAPEPGELDEPSASLPAGIEGCYRMRNSRNQLLRGLEWLLQVACVETDEQTAVLRHPVLPQVTRLVPVRDTLLRESDAAWPTAVFMRDASTEDALEWAGIYFERSNRVSVTLPLLLAIAALLLMASSFVFFPVWLVRWLRGSLRGAGVIAVRAWPLAASALFVFTLWWSTRLELSLLDSINAVSLGIFLGGLAFALVSIFALMHVIALWRAGIHPVAKWHSLLVALACTGVALYLAWWRLVPLRLWAW